MPIYLFTYHAYLSWLPDRPQGYVHHTKGFQTTNQPLADEYRASATDPPVCFETAHQQLLISESLVAQVFQRFMIHAIGTDPSHIHVLVEWSDDRSWDKLRNGLKQSYTRKLNAEFEHRQWFSENASRKRVDDPSHFDHLCAQYLPDHVGLKWDAERGIYC